MTIEEARSLVPVTPTTDPLPLSGPAIPVVGYTAQPAGRPIESGPALPVYVVSNAELPAFGLQAGPAVPMILGSTVGVLAHPVGQRPVPVYVVSGSLIPTPAFPAGMTARWTLDNSTGGLVDLIGGLTLAYVGAGPQTVVGGIIGCAAAFGGAAALSVADTAAVRCDTVFII